MRRKGDAEAEKALLAEIYKLLGNSAYGKFIEAVERQTRVLYTKDEDKVDKHLRSSYFEDLEEIGDAYKIELRKNKVTINRPFQVGIVVYLGTSGAAASPAFSNLRRKEQGPSPSSASATMSSKGVSQKKNMPPPKQKSQAQA